MSLSYVEIPIPLPELNHVYNSHSNEKQEFEFAMQTSR